MSGRGKSPLTCAQAGPMMVAMMLGELGAGESRAVRTHLGSCARCRTEMRELGEALAFLEENNPLAPAGEAGVGAPGGLDESRIGVLMEAAEVEALLEPAAVESPADRDLWGGFSPGGMEDDIFAAPGAARGAMTGRGRLRGALTLAAALDRWGVPRPAPGPAVPAFAGLAVAAILFLALILSLSWPGREAVAGEAVVGGRGRAGHGGLALANARAAAPRPSALRPIRVVEVTVGAGAMHTARGVADGTAGGGPISSGGNPVPDK